IAGFAGFLNCCSSTHFDGSEATISSAFAMAPFMPFAPSVSTSVAPYATSSLRRSMLIVSGIVSVSGMPRAAATNASAIPVFPLVGSTIALPGPSSPRFSASHIIAAPRRHFTEYAGLRPSIFASTVAFAPSMTRLRRTSGVRPIDSELSSNQWGIVFSVFGASDARPAARLSLLLRLRALDIHFLADAQHAVRYQDGGIRLLAAVRGRYEEMGKVVADPAPLGPGDLRAVSKLDEPLRRVLLGDLEVLPVSEAAHHGGKHLVRRRLQHHCGRVVACAVVVLLLA